VSRKVFLTAVAVIAASVGALALAAPGSLLDSKGGAPSDAAIIWIREVGIMLIAIAIMSALVRDQPDSPTLKAFLIGNLVIQLGLLPIELIGHANGVLTKFSGIAPNSILHVLLAGGFAYFAVKIRSSPHERSEMRGRERGI